jgi:hypothetical protein
MDLFVACEFHIFVFKQINSKQITNCVVFKRNTISNTIHHFLSFNNLDAFFGQFLFIITT